MKELPSQTFERIFSIKWPGGRSPLVRLLLHLFFIERRAGSAEANLELQQALLKSEPYLKG